MYNGVPADTVTVRGAQRLGIEAFGPSVTRGVLLDVARTHGVDRLPAGTEITRAMLEQCAESQGVEPAPGDVVLIRTSQLTVFRDGDVHGYHSHAPGLGIDTAAFFHDHSIAAAATDTIAFELLPSKLPEVFVPLHVLCHVMMGMPLGENFDLDALADACALDGRHTFLLDATPLSMTHSTGGMVNPVAMR